MFNLYGAGNYNFTNRPQSHVYSGIDIEEKSSIQLIELLSAFLNNSQWNNLANERTVKLFASLRSIFYLLTSDSKRVVHPSEDSKAKVIRYGLLSEDNVRALNVDIFFDNNLRPYKIIVFSNAVQVKILISKDTIESQNSLVLRGQLEVDGQIYWVYITDLTNREPVFSSSAQPFDF